MERCPPNRIKLIGAVLYEMLAGRRAFVGDDVSDTLVSVFRDDPDWSALHDDVPLRVRQALQVCLQKDPKQEGAGRFGHQAGDGGGIRDHG